jgi:hypothetical protein
VLDGQGAVIAGAHVSARQTETNIVADAVTNSEGRFRFPYLRVGPYELSVRMQGFDEQRRTLTTTVGAAYDIPVVLNVAGVAATVTVSAEATILEAARSQIAGTLSETEIQRLPMNGRNFLDLALLIPGVSPTNIGSAQLFAETSGPRARHFRLEPAKPVQQLPGGRPVCQRRCGRVEWNDIRG